MNELSITPAFNKAAKCPTEYPITQNLPYKSLSVSDFDLEAFMGEFDEFEMTEGEKREVLNALFEIMCRFVELSFGMDSHSLALDAKDKCAQSKENTRRDSADLLE